jgi:hypothetical protein
MSEDQPSSIMDDYIDSWYDNALAAGMGFKSEAERQAYIKSLGDPEEHPMFATDPDILAKHPLTDAFRQLNEEDRTKYELVIMYKEEGNNLVKKADKDSLQKAVTRYTHALTFIEPALEEIKESAKMAPKSKSTTFAEDDESDITEIKSSSVLAFEQQQREFIAKKETDDAFQAEQDAKIAMARKAKGHEAGSKPVKVDIKKLPKPNPLLNFDGDKNDSTPEEIAAKKAKAISGMEGHAGEKVLTFEEVMKKSEARDAKIAAQAGDDISVETVEQTRSQILGNRAMAQLSLKNYGSCVKDCEVALHFWPNNYKAHYRKCKALAALHKYDLVLDAYERCEKLFSSSVANEADKKAYAEVTKVADAAKEQLKKQERLRLKAVVEVEQKKQAILEIYRVCTNPAKGIKLGVPVGMSPAGATNSAAKQLISSNTRCYLSDDDDDEGKQKRVVASDVKYLQQLEHTVPFFDPEEPGSLRFPAVFLYPQHNQLDIIQAAEPQNMLVDYMAHMFPEIETQHNGQSAAPWDHANEYVVSKLICYIHLNGGHGGAVTSEREWLSYHDPDTVLTPEETRTVAETKEYKVDAFCQLHMGCTVQQIVSCERHVLPGGLLHVLVFVNKSASHKKFLQTNRRHRAEMYTLSPSGQMTKQL